MRTWLSPAALKEGASYQRGFLRVNMANIYQCVARQSSTRVQTNGVRSRDINRHATLFALASVNLDPRPDHTPMMSEATVAKIRRPAYRIGGQEWHLHSEASAIMHSQKGRGAKPSSDRTNRQRIHRTPVAGGDGIGDVASHTSLSSSFLFLVWAADLVFQCSRCWHWGQARGLSQSSRKPNKRLHELFNVDGAPQCQTISGREIQNLAVEPRRNQNPWSKKSMAFTMAMRCSCALATRRPSIARGMAAMSVVTSR